MQSQYADLQTFLISKACNSKNEKKIHNFEIRKGFVIQKCDWVHNSDNEKIFNSKNKIEFIIPKMK